MIAQTEIGRMQNLGSASRIGQFAERLGKTAEGKPRMLKKWVHNLIGRPRLGHVRLDGAAIPAEELFEDPVTGDRLRYPHDPGAPASATINCHCGVVPQPVVDRELFDRLGSRARSLLAAA